MEPRLRRMSNAGSSEPPLRAGTTLRNFTLACEGRRAPLARLAQVAQVAQPCRVGLPSKLGSGKAGARPAQRVVLSRKVPKERSD
jgi:hypothetical protein